MNALNTTSGTEPYLSMQEKEPSSPIDGNRRTNESTLNEPIISEKNSNINSGSGSTTGEIMNPTRPMRPGDSPVNLNSKKEEEEQEEEQSNQKNRGLASPNSLNSIIISPKDGLQYNSHLETTPIAPDLILQLKNEVTALKSREVWMRVALSSAVSKGYISNDETGVKFSRNIDSEDLQVEDNKQLIDALMRMKQDLAKAKVC